ncbi:MAG: beta-N-acetylglucosaminidase domain-containing protein [Deltaproteobacteria bacterium]|nr:beta-N-acetylglucosaminidase domain-containing protein [Deltaproteobacteria bacterium]
MTFRIPRRIVLALLVIGLAPAALQRPAAADTGDEPSLALRRAAFERGNLLANGSFEAGARGWRIEGARVSDREAHAGQFALRLAAHAGGHAEAATEVPVLPGLHELSAALRFTTTPRPASGTMAERFRVRVEWLDAQRRPIAGLSGDRPYPLAFLKSAGTSAWRRAGFVSSYENPAGDEAPSGATFARVRFTLAGPGIVEIDDVRFSYSARNLTLEERIAPYRALDDDALGRVVPTPRNLAEHGPSLAIRRLCLHAPEPPPAGFAARVAEFEERLRELGAVLITPGSKGEAPAGCDATLRFARADGKVPAVLAATAAAALRLGPEGYALRSRTLEPRGLSIEAAGADGPGAIYALETLRQLLRPADEGGAALRAVDGTDWPAFRGRSLAAWEPGILGARSILSASRWMVGLKLNRLYLNYPLRTPRWWEPPRLYRALLEDIGERAMETQLYQLGILLNPYAQRSESGITDTFQISRKEDVDILLSEIDQSLEAGARIVMLCLDDFLPATVENPFAYHLDDAHDRARFPSLAAAHLWLIDQVRQRVRASQGAMLVIVPPWYNDQFRERGGAEADAYMTALGRELPPDVVLAWTGPTVRSRIVDGTSAAGFADTVGGRPLILWDNSVWELELSPHYAGSPDRAAKASLFEPFFIEAEDLPASSFEGEFYFNGSTGGRFLAKAMTLADYLWNPEAYDADRSMWRAMVRRWGAETAGLILDWDSAYWKERLWINRLAAVDGAPESGLLRDLEGARATSAERWRALRAALVGKDHELIRELEGWVKEQAARFAEARIMKPARTSGPSGG